jgi:phosphate butyryltransferase
LDVALSKEAAATKAIESEVAGDVDILLFPDLNSGNVAYKSFTYMAGATIAGKSHRTESSGGDDKPGR